MTIALIDGDIIAYRCSAACENESVELALIRTYDMMQNILTETGATAYKCFLSGKGNFRNDINPGYKANRKDKVDPIHRQVCKDFLISDWNAVVCDGYEADDALAMEQSGDWYVNTRFGFPDSSTSKVETIICSIDKDLLQVPGKHYNFVKKEFSEVSKVEGLRNFYKQMLIGDSSDNIFGVSGIGKVKAAKYIDPLENEEIMLYTILDLYRDSLRLAMNADCLWLMRKENEKWTDRRAFEKTRVD